MLTNFKEKVRNNVSKLAAGALTSAFVAEATIRSAFADDDVSWIFQKPSKDPLAGLTTSVKNVGASGYALSIVLGSVLLAIYVVILFIKFMGSNSGQDLKESKGKLVMVVVGGIGIFSAPFIVTTLMGIGQGLN